MTLIPVARYRFNLTLGNIYRAPLTDPQSVLDLGTGTGIWAIDMAEYDNDTF